jgi:spermidine synthase
MKPTEVLARETTPEGDALVLTRRDGVFRLTVDGQELMSSRAHGSEDALARLAWENLKERKAPRVLVGGLGFGFTLRATLGYLPPQATVVVCEFFACLLEWNRGLLADLARRPLEDKRVRTVRADIWDFLDGRERFDAILLDVDNGPEAFTLLSNHRLYTREGLARIAASLNPGGVLAVWSAGSSPVFQARLRKAGFEARTVRVPIPEGAPGKGNAIFVAKPAGAARRSAPRRR